MSSFSLTSVAGGATSFDYDRDDVTTANSTDFRPPALAPRLGSVAMTRGHRDSANLCAITPGQSCATTTLPRVPEGICGEHEDGRQRAEAKAEKALTGLTRKHVQQLECRRRETENDAAQPPVTSHHRQHEQKAP